MTDLDTQLGEALAGYATAQHVGPDHAVPAATDPTAIPEAPPALAEAQPPATDPYAAYPKAQHLLTLTLNEWGVLAKVTCLGGSDARCHQWCARCTEGQNEACSCTDPTPLTDQGRCLPTEWLNEDEVLECHDRRHDGRHDTPIRSGLIDIAWNGDSYSWTFADTPTQADLLALVDALTTAAGQHRTAETTLAATRRDGIVDALERALAARDTAHEGERAAARALKDAIRRAVTA